jgi:hypothetical protein
MPAYTIPSVESDLVVTEGGVSVYQSMGNAGPGNAAPVAVAKNTVTVGGLYHQDNRNLSDDAWRPTIHEEDMASTGPTLDGRIKPDLVGPFDQITVASYDEEEDQGAYPFARTSAANPIVAGVGALVEEVYDDGGFLDADENATEGTPGPALTKALLINSAHTFALPEDDPDDIDGSEDDYVDPSNTRHLQGWGQPNVTVLADANWPVFTVDESVELATGSRYQVEYNVSADADALRVSLVWTDPPATVNQRLMKDRTDNEANVSALVNDLDLEVEAPNGTTYLGNGGLMSDNRSDPVNTSAVGYPVTGADPVNTSAVGYPVTGADRVNNVENVFVPHLDDTDVWTTTVKATALDADATPGTATIDQPFGLVLRPIGESTDDDGGGNDGGSCCSKHLMVPAPG